MSDPNQPYVPQPYPKMLYRDRTDYRTVRDEAEHEAASEAGYVAYCDLPPANPDNLDLLTDDQLRAKLLEMARLVMLERPRSELLFAIRFQVECAERAKAEAAPAPVLTEDTRAIAASLEGAEDGDDIIYGSSVHPDVIALGGLWVHMWAVVNSAYTDTGLSLADWNDLPKSDRDDLIQLTIDRLAEADADTVVAELGEDAVTEAPEPAPEPETTDAEIVSPLYHEGDDGLAELRAELIALGGKPHHKAGPAKLRDDIAKLKAKAA